MEILKLELERLIREAEVFKRAFVENRKKQDEIKIALFKDEMGWKEGDDIRLKDGMTVGNIDRFEAQYGQVYPVLKLWEKDGTLGKQDKILSSYEIAHAVKI